MQQYFYDKQFEAKLKILSFENNYIKDIATSKYPKNFEMQVEYYETNINKENNIINSVNTNEIEENKQKNSPGGKNYGLKY